MTSTIQNEVDLKRVQAGTEAVYGTAVAPTFRLGGDLVINKDRPLVDRPVRDGTYNVSTSAKRGTTTIDGTYADDLSFEDGPILMRYGVSAPPTPVSDGETVPGFDWEYRPGQSLFQSFSAEHGNDGLKREATGLQFNEFTIGAGDPTSGDGNWTFSGTLVVKSDSMGTVTPGTATGGTTTTIVNTGGGWTIDAEIGKFAKLTGGTAANIGEIRQITDNDATSLTLDMALPAAVVATDTYEVMEAFTSLASRTVNYIPIEGTQIFLADDVAGLATASNEIEDKLISWSVTQQNRVRNKKFQNNIGGNSSKRGRGRRFITGTTVWEFDDWGEYKNWEASVPTARAIKLQQLNGPVIDAGAGTNMEARIVIPKIEWGRLNPNQDRNGNVTVAMDFWAYHDTGEGYDIEYGFVNTLATLP